MACCEADATLQAGAVRQSLRLLRNLHLHHRAERGGEAGLSRAVPGSTSCVRVVRLGAASAPMSSRRRTKRARSSRCWRATSCSRAIGGGPTPMPNRCARAGTSPATPALSTTDGDLFVTGRVDDMIITGGENVSPVEIESCLSLHPAVSEVAVVGLADERWGKIVAAFVKRRGAVARRRSRRNSAALRGLPVSSGRADYVFVEAIPKSPVGKLLRRMLVAGEYEPERGRHLAQETIQHEHRTPHRICRPSPRALDGFRVEIDAARERADIILDRPPSTSCRCRSAISSGSCSRPLDEDARVRVIVLRAIGEHFSSGGNIEGFLEATPEHVSKLAWNIAAPARCAKPVIAANRGYCFGVGFRTVARLRLPHRLGDVPLCVAGAAAWTDSRARAARRGCRRCRHHPHQGHRHALAAHSRRTGP